jgi:adenylate kinase family enzyme
MGNKTHDNSFVFIIGSPRSGTTVLGEILEKHQKISQWYEPYFIWDRYFRNHLHDERTAEDATTPIGNQIYTEFINYKKRTGSRIIVDKSPRNSLKIPFIRKIFQQARFIHIVRDGRDVTLSINKEWMRRRSIVFDSQINNDFNYRQAFRVIFKWLNRQTFFKDKIRAFWFETHGHLFNRLKHLNRLRWNGEVGWGPRFKDWNNIFYQTSLLQFNAYQWLKCIESISMYWPEISNENKLEIRYEELINQGEEIIIKILGFLGLNSYEEFFASIPKLKKNNFNKWQKEFSKEQAREIQAVLSPMLVKLGYEDDYNWLQKMA